jgi:hypothetical protein
VAITFAGGRELKHSFNRLMRELVCRRTLSS